MAAPRICGIHPSIDGGTELWIQSSLEPPNGQWEEGWHTPKPHTEWWSSGCKDAAWTLLGHQLVDNEIGEVKKAFLRDADCPDAGYWSMNPDGSYEFYTNAKIKINPEGKGRPKFEKLPGKGRKGKEATQEPPSKRPKMMPPGGDGGKWPKRIPGKRQKGKKVMEEPPNKCPQWTPEGDGGNSGASSSSSMPKAANKVGPSKAPWIDGPRPPSTPPRPSLLLRRSQAIGAPFRTSFAAIGAPSQE